MKSVKNYLFLIPLFFSMAIHGQAIEVSALIDSSEMLIGQQRRIRLEAIHPQSVTVHFPVVGQTDTLVPGVEILRISPLDTVVENGAKIKVSQEYLVTSFDTGRYVIPPFKFSTQTREFETGKVLLNVSTIEADFDNAQMTDIMDNYDPGFNWKRFFLYFSLLLILAGFAYIGYYIYQYIQRKKLQESGEFVEVDNRLPHEIALQELDEIKEQKVWKQGMTKQYYTGITDTLREYFVKRFQISAMEMTSAEIMDNLKYNNDAAPILDRMRQIFSTSDMVKFAKQEPTQEENEISIMNAYYIVNQTTVIPVDEPKEDKQEESVTDK